jgi:hypothetical protein
MELSLININNNQQVELEKNNQHIISTPEIIENVMSFSDQAIGKVQCSVMATPNITLFHGSINLNNPVTLKTMASPNSLNVCIMMDGFIETNFYSHRKNLNLFASSHNSIYLIESEGEHQLPKGENKAFHLNIKSEHFFNNFNSEDAITEKFKNSIYKNIPYLASPNPHHISPEMRDICPHQQPL